MGIFGWFDGLFGGATNSLGCINPANGLPMVGAVDIEGNPYGTDSHHESTTALFSDDDIDGIQCDDTAHADESHNTISDDPCSSDVFENEMTSCFDDDWSSSCFDD